MAQQTGKVEQVLELINREPWGEVYLPPNYMEEFSRKLAEIQFVRHESGIPHNSFAWGNAVFESVKNHDLQGLELLLQAPSQQDWRHGVLGPTALRSSKNACIALITYIAHSLIREGYAENEQMCSMCDASMQLLEEAASRKEVLLSTYGSLYMISELVHTTQRPDHHYLVRQAKDYVFKHLHERITVETVAEHLKISVPYLSRIFKEAESVTLKQYIQTERVDSAKKLLKYSDDSIQSISQYLAFSSQSHFTELFRRHTGMTPLAYRNRFSALDRSERSC